MEAEGCYPGSVGELLQGNFQGRDILLSCPVNLYTRVKLFESKSISNKYKNEKADKFLLNMLNRWECGMYYNTLDIEICSHIPKGKGFSSSTADLCALYKALLKLFNKKFNQQELLEECILIEPTDSIIFGEMTLFDYKNGSFHKSMGSYFEFYVVVYEGNNIVDTIEFNKRALQPLANIEDLVPVLEEGITEKDINKIGFAASESIVRNQQRLKYGILGKVLDINKKTGGAGVLGAHSGDCLGIIFDDEERAKYTKEHYLFQDSYRNYIVKSIKIF